MRLVGVIAVLLLLGSNVPHVAIAQALAAVDSGFSWGPVLVIAAIGLAIAGLVLWHKRNPSKADEAIKEGLDKARQEASELAHKTIDAVNRLVRTNEAQAMVIASPPVQAAINAGTPVPAPAPAQTLQPAAQNAPQATNAPAPVSSPQPQPAVAPAAVSVGVKAMPADITINPADYPAMDPQTGRPLDPALQTSDPQAFKMAVNIWGRNYPLPLMTDSQLRQAALYESQRNRAQARDLIAKGYATDNPGILRMLRSPEEIYVRLLKKTAGG